MKVLLIFSIVLFILSFFVIALSPLYVLGILGVVTGALLFTLSATKLDYRAKKKAEQLKKLEAEKKNNEEEDYNVYLEDIDEMVEYLKESIYTYEESNEEISAELKTQLKELKVALENFNPIYGTDAKDLDNEDEHSDETLDLDQEVKEEYIVCDNCGMSNKKTNRKCSSCGLSLKQKTK